MRTPRLHDVFTFLRWLPDYDGRAARADLVAGVAIAVMVIPQSMAYALLAGVPPIYGLYASLVPLLIYPIFGSSKHLAVGVIAIDMLIVHAGLSGLAPAGSARYVELAILLALMVGVIQIVMGLTRMGFLVNLLSRPVMVGFTSGAAVLIALSQAAGLAGLEVETASVLPGIVWEFFRHVGETDFLTLGLGAASLLALLAFKRWAPRAPSYLIVFAVGTALVALLGLGERGVELVGDVPSGFPSFGVPLLDGPAVSSLVTTAVALALVQFLTVTSLGKVFAARNGYAIDANRELLAIGAANLGGALFRGIPVSGSFSRTAMNEQSGSRSPMVNIFAALIVGVGLLSLTPLLGLVPVAVLSAIIVVAALGLLDVEQMRFLLRAKTVDGWIAILTFVATATAGILEGIFLGVGASLIALLYRISRPNAAVLGHLPGTRSFRDVRHSSEARSLEGILILRIDASFSFMNAEYLRDLILDRTAREDSPVRCIIVDAHSVNDLDTTAAEVLLSVSKSLEERGIQLLFAGVKEPVYEVLRRTELFDELGSRRFFLSPHRAVKYALEERGTSEAYLRDVPGGMSVEED